MARGLFDRTLVPEGWFSELLQPAGWFDADLLDAISGGGGGGSSTDAFYDNFDDNSKDAAKWMGTAQLIGPVFFLTQAGSVAEVSGRVELTTPASADGVDGYASLSSTIDLSGRSMRIRMVPPGTNPVTTPGHFYFVVADVSDGIGGASYWGGWHIHLSRFGTQTITAGFNNAGDPGTPWSDTYDSTVHTHLRLDFAADGSSMSYYTAPDVSGAPGTWVLRRTITGAPYAGFASARIGFYAEADNDLQPALTWQADNFNWVPGAGGVQRLKFWDGAAWVDAAAVNVWNGSAWAAAQAKAWSGSAWI